MTYRGHVKDRVVVFDTRISLPDRMIVRILPIDTSLDIEGNPIDPDYSDRSRLFHRRSAIETEIPDLGRNIDHYLYGHPKVVMSSDLTFMHSKGSKLMTYRGHVKGGVIVIDPTIPLPEGSEVTVELVDTAIQSAEDPEHPFLKMLDLAVDMGIPDLATNIDHYLYGHPKVTDGE